MAGVFAIVTFARENQDSVVFPRHAQGNVGHGPADVFDDVGFSAPSVPRGILPLAHLLDCYNRDRHGAMIAWKRIGPQISRRAKISRKSYARSKPAISRENYGVSNWKVML